MRTQFSHRRRLKLASVVLVLLLFRAYVPVGFMPAAGTPFLLELCPATAPLPVSAYMPTSALTPMAAALPMSSSMSMPMPMGAQHPHSPLHAHFDHCPFGSAPGAGPVSHGIVFEPPGLVVANFAVAGDALPIVGRPTRAHQARGPPSLV